MGLSKQSADTFLLKVSAPQRLVDGIIVKQLTTKRP